LSKQPVKKYRYRILAMSYKAAVEYPTTNLGYARYYSPSGYRQPLAACRESLAVIRRIASQANSTGNYRRQSHATTLS
jgi:hypothetical protein